MLNTNTYARCEWCYIDGSRCQNVLSLIEHHRTYDELPAPLTNTVLLCPAHHLIADLERKIAIGQKPEIVSERILYAIEKKKERIPPDTFRKFISRFFRELKITEDQISIAYSAFRKVVHEMKPTNKAYWFGQEEYVIDVDRQTVRNALYYVRIMHLCVSTPEFEIINGDFANQIEAQLNTA